MYESFYGLKEKPFTLLPDPDFLYLSSKHQRALIMLQYGLMNKAGFSVICGDIGAGKTTLIRQLLLELNDDVTVGMIANTHKSFGDLLSWVLEAFGLDGEGKSRAQMHRVFTDFLIQQYAASKHSVLIVDEAQNMDEERLEELRMLSNVNADKDQLLQVILAGQPSLRDMLRKPELLQFAQRIAVDYYLDSLDHQETCAYIQHRLKVAGAAYNIFTEDACDAVFKYSGGTPRLINLLCDTALVYGFAEQIRSIDARLVNDVVREQLANGVAPSLHNIDDLLKSNPVPAPQPAPSPETSSSAGGAPMTDHPGVSTLHADDTRCIDNSPRLEAKNTESCVAETETDVATSPPAAESPDKADSIAAETNPHAVEERWRTAQEQVAREQTAEANRRRREPVDQVLRVGQEQDDDEDFHHGADHDNENPPRPRNYPRQVQRDAAYYDNMYPLVQVEPKEKKSSSYLILGLALGLFLATLLIVVAGYMMFYKNPWLSPKALVERTSPTAESSVSAELAKQQQLESAKVEALQKERDAALAMTRALESERDAALAAARAQEEMREAERRAAELMAQQERRTADEIKRAQEQARKAEIAAARARERERLARELAEQARIDAERAKAAKPIVVEKIVPVAPQGASMDVVEPPAPVYGGEPAVKNDIPKPASDELGSASSTPSTQDQANKFSANPCNSASAKFLSTCKK